MTKPANNTIQAFQALAVSDLDDVSDEAIRAELLEDGKDPDALAREIAEHLDGIAAQFMRDRVAASKAVKKATDVSTPKARPSLKKIKELVRRAFNVEPGLAAAFRDGSKQSDNDLVTLFDDLVVLGKINLEADD